MFESISQVPWYELYVISAGVLVAGFHQKVYKQKGAAKIAQVWIFVLF